MLPPHPLLQRYGKNSDAPSANSDGSLPCNQLAASHARAREAEAGSSGFRARICHFRLCDLGQEAICLALEWGCLSSKGTKRIMDNNTCKGFGTVPSTQ